MAPVKGRRQISELRLCGAPLGVIRVHGMAGVLKVVRLGMVKIKKSESASNGYRLFFFIVMEAP